MKREPEKIKIKFKKFLDSLVEIAMEDELISEDEQKLIDTIHDGIENLEVQLMQILEDDLDEDEFEDIVEQIMQDVIYNATQEAESDGIITEDESKLLTKLNQFAELGVFADE